MELIVRPERIIESEITKFLRIVCIKESGSGSHHIDAKLAVKIFLSLVKRTNTNSNLYTHQIYYIANILKFFNLTQYIFLKNKLRIPNNKNA